MKVLNLQCAQGHGFEGWFGSDDDYQQQQADGRLCCPLCDDRHISQLPSAPRLNLSGAREPMPASSSVDSPAPPAADIPVPAGASLQGQALWLKMVQRVMKDTVDVGERFPEEARRMHYGEAQQRGIRGQASAEERAELADEGIEVMPLPLPAGLKGRSH